MERIWISDTVNQPNQEVTLCGWVHVRRDMGKLIFIDLRDRTGIVQVVFLPNHKEALTIASELRPEDAIKITGKVNPRPESQVNTEMLTGTVEIEALELTILSKAETPPFEINNETVNVDEELRMEYRYLDLRTQRMQRNMQRRHDVILHLRNYLDQHGFREIETPLLTKSTPEGSRDYLVPARNIPGTFYALPQSPQQFKQLLMVGGIERYYQFAKCLRDEDPRKDRQPEHTQLDLEMSFVEREDVMQFVETMYTEMVQKLFPDKKIQQTPFPRLTYKESMEKYGNDKPDLRKDKNDPNELAFCWVIDFPFFEKDDDGGWTFTHNPFSSPIPEHREWLMNKENIGEILTTQYDIVLNGYEIGGGSIRNHQPEALRKVFEVMGYTAEEIEADFGHMLKAFSYGAPPHGGIGSGQDRLIAILLGEYESIRDVIAFPKTTEGRDLVMDAPSVVPQTQLDELGITMTKRAE